MSDVAFYYLDTIAGMQKFPVPSHFELDDTGKVCWMHLLYSVKEWDKLLKDPSPTRKQVKERDQLDQKNNILGNVLARTYGMAATYYILEARRMQDHWK